MEKKWNGKYLHSPRLIIISNKLNVLWFAYSKYFDTVTGTYEKSCT
jgi:hypothetical protein